jgi:type IV pilus assembly protein PilM
MRILGIEFGGWSLKAVEMESRFRRFEILDLHEVRLPLQPADPIAAYRKAVEELLAKLPNHPEKVAASLPPTQVALRFIEVPLKQRKKVEQSFRFELEDSVPFKLDDSIVEHQIYPTKEGSLVFSAIAPKRNIQSHLDWLKAAGIDPDWLTFEGMGLVNLYLASLAAKDAEKPVGPVMLMDIGHLKTNIAIVDQNRPELIRSISWGGLALTQSIANSLGLSLEEAEKKKIASIQLQDDYEPANAEAEELMGAAANAFSTFLADISHSLVAFRTQFKGEIGKIMITGGTAKMKGIDNFLNRALGVPVEYFRPFKNLSFSREVDATLEMRFSEPLGRAFVFNRKSGLLFNFRKENLAKSTELTEVGGALKDPNMIKLAGYAGIFAIILFFGIFTLGYLANEESHKATEELRRVLNDTFPSVTTKQKNSLSANPNELKKYIDQKNNELAQKIKMASKTRTPMLGLLRAVSDAFPPDVKVDVNSLSLDDRSVKVEGVLYEGTIEKVLETMKKVPTFNNVTVEKDGQRFTFKGEVVGR